MNSATHHCQVAASPWPGLYVTHIESARHYARHWHATYGIGLVEDGAHSSASGRGAVDAYAGDLVTTNPGEVHDGRPLGGPSRRWRTMYLEPEVLASMTGHREPAIARPVIQDARLRRSLQRLFARLDRWHAWRCPAAAETLACEEALVETCAVLLDRHGTAPPLRDARADVRQVRDRLADAPIDPPSLTEMATACGLSKYQLLRRFEQSYGMPPHAWLMAQRAERARGLIRAGSALAVAAACAGFADQSHMTRVFARRFGFTPGALQRAHRRLQ